MTKCDADTKDFFERQYAEAAGLSCKMLAGMGYAVVACDCGADDCIGWRMELDFERLADRFVQTFSDVLSQRLGELTPPAAESPPSRR